MNKCINIKKVWFGHGTSNVILEIPEYLTNTCQIPGIKKSVLEAFPSIQHHHCHNDNGFSFEDELDNTELAHLLEHILIELISEKDINSDNIIGWTKWNWKINPYWHYEIEIGYPNKTVFLSALSETFKFMESLVSEVSAPHFSGELVSGKIPA